MMIQASVLPADVRKYENMVWEQHLTFLSNLGFVSIFITLGWACFV